MKARIKKTGEIVNLASYAPITLNMCDSWGNPIEMKPEEVELIQDKTNDFDWQSFRAEAAKDILCAMISSTQYWFSEPAFDSKVDRAIRFADKLIAKLKEKEHDEATEVVDFFSVHSKEEVAEMDKRIESKQKEYDAKRRDSMMKAKDFPMTD